jgi:hypothetical protein
VETHSPFGAPAAFALRTAMAFVTGSPANDIPAASQPLVAAEAWMKARLLSFMWSS